MTDVLDDEFKALAAEYALGLLSPAESRAFEQAMATDPELRDTYAAWAEDFAAMTDGIAPVAPPAALQGRIETAIFGATKPQQRSFLDRFTLLPAAMTGLVLAASVLLVVDFRSGPPEFVPELSAQVAASDQSLVFLAAYDADTGILRVDRQAGAAASGRSLELWLIAGVAAPVSLGVLPDAATADLTIPADLAAGLMGGILAVSDEPLGGSTTGAPTGEVLATGAVTSV